MLEALNKKNKILIKHVLRFLKEKRLHPNANLPDFSTINRSLNRYGEWKAIEDLITGKFKTFSEEYEILQAYIRIQRAHRVYGKRAYRKALFDEKLKI